MDAKNRRLILVALVILVLVCLVGVLIYRIFFTNGGGEIVSDTPTPTLAPTEEEPTVVITPEEEVTPTPTRVVAEKPTNTPTPEATIEPTTEPTTEPATPTKALAEQPDLASDLNISTGGVEPGAIADQLKNGDFEAGFSDQGVALEWHSFKTDGAAVAFSGETPGPYVKSGAGAQRISIAEASQADRYAGIYQQLAVAPNQTYTLELHGQIRTGFADINLSSYGYRLQYAIDYTDGDNWQDIPAEDWVELPWNEQLLHSPDVKFLDYTTEITPTSNQLTLFVRAWNKWADPGLAEYTLDSLSLTGSSPVYAAATTETGEALIDQPLPTTGAGDSAGLMSDGRFWGAVLILLLLAAGAIYRRRWGY